MRSVSKKLTGSIVLLFLGFVLFLAIKSFSSSQANKSAYPGPVDVQATQVNKLAYPGPVDIQATQVDKPAYPGPVDIQATPLSPEALCERWFSFRQAFSAEKRAMLEEDYKNCVNARLTPSPAGVDKLIDSTPPVGEYTVAEVKRVAGSGTILERSFSMLNSAYFTVKNMWKADLDGEHITVYAGGRRTNVSAAELVSNDLAWLGALVIIMTDQDGNPIPGRGEEYLTPVNAGAVRIVDAAGTTLNLAAKDGTSFAFDVANREFVPAVTSSPFKRSAGIGTIVESGKSACVLDDFDFVNYWFYDKKGSGRITLLAGKERNNPRTGVLVMIVSSSSDNSIIIRETVYKAVSVSALRIVSAADDVITLISENDLIYDFNVTGQRFVTLPSDSEAPIVIPLITEASGNGQGSLGITPTPRLTRTALPTNPYP